MTKHNPKKTGGKAPPRGRPKDPAKREAVLAEAFDLFLEVGFGGATMDALARRASLSKATLYSHFGSKNDIFKALIDEKIAEYYQVSTDSSRVCPRADLIHLAEQFFELIHDERALALTRLIVGAAATHPQIVEVFHNTGPERIKQDFVRAITRLGEVEPKAAAGWAQIFMSLIVPHFYYMELLVGQALPLTKAERKKHIAKHVDLFFSLL